MRQAVKSLKNITLPTSINKIDSKEDSILIYLYNNKVIFKYNDDKLHEYMLYYIQIL